MEQEQQKALILEKALRHVPFDGWTDAVLYRAAEEAGITDSDRILLFPHGVADLVEFFTRQMDAQMLEALQKLNITEMRVRDRIATAVKTRIMLYDTLQPVAARTLTFFAMPQHTLQAFHSLCKTVDAMWHAAGDTATDFNYYSKRFLLGGVYSSTLLYWLDDRSEDYKDSWDFLDRRITNVLQFGKFKQGLKDKAGLVGDIPFLRLLWRKTSS